MDQAYLMELDESGVAAYIQKYQENLLYLRQSCVLSDGQPEVRVVDLPVPKTSAWSKTPNEGLGRSGASDGQPHVDLCLVALRRGDGHGLGAERTKATALVQT